MEKNSRKFSLVWKGSVLVQKLCSRRKAQAACKRKIGLRLSRPLCPWLGMSWESGTSAQVVQMWHYFTCPTYQRCKGKIPLSPLKLGRLNRIHFPKDPFMEEHHQCGWQVIAEGSMAKSVGWVERGTPCAASHGLTERGVLRCTARCHWNHCHWNQKHLVSGQDVSETEKSFEIP